MQNNTTGEVDPWASMGNLGGNTSGNQPSAEQIERAESWSSAMSDVEFSGDSTNNTKEQSPEERDDGIANASALINYGLNAAARELGVETVVQKIKSFDATGSENPIRDLYVYLGIDTPEEVKDLHEESIASKNSENAYRESENAPTSTRRSTEGAFKAIYDFKELISEVEGADPCYNSLRAGAKAMNMGYFDYAVYNYGVRGLTELFQALKSQKDAVEAPDFDTSSNGQGSATAEDDANRKEETIDENLINNKDTLAEPTVISGPEKFI